MSALRTHYDNLHVARNAAPEVIAAAYRTLSLKYHPDRNGGDARCAEIMRILNRSYAALSDVTQRSAHDAWIARTEGQGADHNTGSDSEHDTSRTKPSKKHRLLKHPVPRFAMLILRRYGWLLIVVLFITAIGLIPSPKPQPSGLSPYNASPAAEASAPDAPASRPTYARPANAPNGSPWPNAAGYVAGYPRLRAKGISTVTVDNSSNADDVFVKLVAIDAASTKPVRQFFIPAHGEFTAEHLTPGTYDVRYMSLSTGTLARTPSFLLQQTREFRGTRFSAITMTLYEVANGNMKTFPLLPSEF